MIFISLLILIVAIALPSIKTHLSPVLITRITSIILFYSGVLAFNALYIQSIGSGIGVYSGIFHVTTISQQLDIFLIFMGFLISFIFNYVYKYFYINNVNQVFKELYIKFWYNYSAILSLPLIYITKSF